MQQTFALGPIIGLGTKENWTIPKITTTLKWVSEIKKLLWSMLGMYMKYEAVVVTN